MAGVVVRLDLIHVAGRGHARCLVEVPQVIEEIGKIRDPVAVALEVVVVDRIESQERDEQPPVGFGDLVAGQVALAAQPLFQPVQRLEQWPEGGLIGLLGGGETAFVDAVVHRVVDHFVEGIDLAALRLRVEVGDGLRDLVRQAVKGAVQHAQDFPGLIADDASRLLVPEHRHGGAPRKVRLAPGIDFMHPFRADHRVGARGEAPAVVIHVRVGDTDGDDILQLLEFAHDGEPVTPGAGVADIEVVAPGLGGVGAAAVCRDPVAEARVLTHEAAAGAGRVQPAAMPFAIDQVTHCSLPLAGTVTLQAAGGRCHRQKRRAGIAGPRDSLFPGGKKRGGVS